MIADHDRSGWIGASDTDYVVGNWDTATWEKWMLTKLGIHEGRIETSPNYYIETFLLLDTS